MLEYFCGCESNISCMFKLNMTTIDSKDLFRGLISLEKFNTTAFSVVNLNLKLLVKPEVYHLSSHSNSHR